MRRPSDDATALAWYWKALNDASLHLDLTIDYNLPECGWFQTRLVRGGPMVPARIWLEQEIDIATGELISDEVLKCEINGREADPIDGWQRCAANPIERSLFNFLTATVKWAGDNAPAEPMANPYRSTDWLQVPTPTF